jgi:hypothetical protein
MFNNYNISSNQSFNHNSLLDKEVQQAQNALRNQQPLTFSNQLNPTNYPHFQQYQQQQPFEHQQNYSQSINNLYNTAQFNPFPNQQHSKSYSLPAIFNEPQIANSFASPNLTNQLLTPPPVRLSSSIPGDVPLPFGWTAEKSQTGQTCFIK